MSTDSPEMWLLAIATLLAGLCPSAAPAQTSNAGGPRGVELPESIRRIMESFDEEPSIREVQNAALQHADLERTDKRNWAGRARLSNLFPEVDGEIAWLDQKDAQLRYSEDIESRDSGEMYRDAAENRLSEDSRLRRAYSIDATIDLGGLVFDRDELSASREQRQRELARRKLVGRVTDLYFERRKKQILGLVDPPGDWRGRLDLLLDIERLTARLNGLTGGWFRDKLPDSKRSGGTRE